MEPEAGLAWFEPGGGLLRLALATQSPVHDLRTIAGMLHDHRRAPRRRRDRRLSPGRWLRGARPGTFPAYLAMLAVLAGGTRCASPSTSSTSSRPASSGRPPRSGGACGWPPTGASSRSTPTSRFDAGGRANLRLRGVDGRALGRWRLPRPLRRRARQRLRSREVQAGSQRGFGGAEAALVVETLLDEAATRDGHDPIEVRRLSLLGAATARSRAR